VSFVANEKKKKKKRLEKGGKKRKGCWFFLSFNNNERKMSINTFFGGNASSSASSSSNSSAKSRRRERPVALIPWVEKYRPKTVDEVSHQDEIVTALKKSLETGQLPHLLFYGPPGTGKTSTILAIAHQLFGSVLSSLLTHSLSSPFLLIPTLLWNTNK
jgi:predicted AAA+ superfamily ATPase